MARDYGPFDTRPMYDVVNRRMQRAFNGATGLLGPAGTQGLVTAGTGAELIIAAYPNGALVDGLYVENPTSEAVPLAVNSGSTNPRIDRLVLRLDMGAKTIAPHQIVGTPAASPTAPSLTQTASVFDMPLCQYRLPGSASAQNPGSIVDERPWIDAGEPPGGLLHGSGTQDVGSGVNSGVVLTSVAKANGLDSSTSGRLNIQRAGYYECSGAVEFSGHASGRRLASIGVNGASYLRSQNTVWPGTTDTASVATASIPIPLKPGDQVILMGYQDSGAILKFNRDTSFLRVSYVGSL